MLLADDAPLRRIRRAWVTWGLILACILVFALQCVSDAPFHALALHPAELLRAPGDPEVQMRLLGYMLLHGGILHLLGNLLALSVFGDNVEDAFGHLRFALLYGVSGVVAAFTQAVAEPDPRVVLVGASGAIAGVMAAYLLLFPRAKLYVLAFARLPVLVPAGWFVGAWFGLNLLNALSREAGEVAHWAHVGGFLAGILLTLLARPPGVPLFQPAFASPTPPWPWFRRVAFDFAPEVARRDGPAGSAMEARDSRLAAIGKAVAFLVLTLLSAWF